MAKGDSLGEFEQLVLLAILRLPNNAYGVTIRHEIETRAQRRVASGAVYSTLERLVSKGFVSGTEGEPEPSRGGRAKVYYRVEAPGFGALKQSEQAYKRMRHGVKLAQEMR